MSEFSIPGVRLGVAQAGIKYEGRDDLTLIEIAEGSSTAAVFTLNAVSYTHLTLPTTLVV